MSWFSCSCSSFCYSVGGVCLLWSIELHIHILLVMLIFLCTHACIHHWPMHLIDSLDNRNCHLCQWCWQSFCPIFPPLDGCEWTLLVHELWDDLFITQVWYVLDASLPSFKIIGCCSVRFILVYILYLCFQDAVRYKEGICTCLDIMLLAVVLLEMKLFNVKEGILSLGFVVTFSSCISFVRHYQGC
jgi:hypothetical protein